MNAINEEPEPPEIEALLPWYAAGTLTCRSNIAHVSHLSAGLATPRKRTGGNQHVTVKHFHQQVNVTEGGQAVVVGDKVMSRTRGRRRRGARR
jgi:hypothetical protein